MDVFRDPYHCDRRIYDFSQGICPAYEDPRLTGKPVRYVISVHFHDALECLYVHKGHLTMTIEGETKELTVGDMALIEPFTTHYGYIHEEDRVEFTCVGIGKGVVYFGFPLLLQDVFEIEL